MKPALVMWWSNEEIECYSVPVEKLHPEIDMIHGCILHQDKLTDEGENKILELYELLKSCEKLTSLDPKGEPYTFGIRPINPQDYSKLIITGQAL